MNALRTLTLPALFCAAAASAGDLPPPLVCTPEPPTCEPRAVAPLGPQLQRLLVEWQLQSQPPAWTAVYFYLPMQDERESLELQIRYLEQLLSREKAKAEQLARGE
jgi:hypothetical protein